ncbi:hypothetical protein [Nocardia sp. IFM 10818]
MTGTNPLSHNASHDTITSASAPWWRRFIRPSRAQDTLTLLEDISASLLNLQDTAEPQDKTLSDLLTVMEDIRDELRANRNRLDSEA